MAASLFNSVRRRFNLITPDFLIIKRQYFERTGENLNLRDPQGFHQKICRMRLGGMTPLHVYCTDKVTAPSYIASRIGFGHVPKRYMVTDDPDRISVDSIPAQSCMVKTTHDSGGVFPISDTSKVDWTDLRTRIKCRLHNNFYYRSRESQYRSIKPAVIVEELLCPKSNQHLSELKVFCFHGQVKFMVLIFDGILSKNSKRRYFDRAWNPLEVNRRNQPFSLGMASRLDGLDTIISHAEAIAEPFSFVRVDFLLVDSAVYVGELTFTPSAGYDRYSPDSFEFEAGNMLDLRVIPPDWRPYLNASRRVQAETQHLEARHHRSPSSAAC
jgi:hypothetical protein